MLRIGKLVNFLYSSDDSNKVPFRLSLTTGQFSGYDLDKEQCEVLLDLLIDPKNYNKEKFDEFLNKWMEK